MSFAESSSGSLGADEMTVQYGSMQIGQEGDSAEQQLRSECELMWEDLHKIHGRLQSSAPTGWSTKEAADADVLECVLKAREGRLQAEILAQEHEGVDVISSHPEYVEALSKEQLATTTEQLEDTLFGIKAQIKEMTNETEREKEIIQQHTEIRAVLLQRISELEQEKENFGGSSQMHERELKKKAAEAHLVKIMRKLGSFMKEHFPSPSSDAVTAWAKGSVSGRNSVKPGVKYVPLQKLVEDLMNSLYDKPHDPYIRIQDNHWPPYIELLLRFGIAERHKEDCSLIRLVAFHM